MKETLKLFKSDKVVSSAYLLSTVSFFIVGAAIAVAWSHLAPYLPIFLKLAWGYDRVGLKIEMLYPLALWFVELVIAFWLIRPVYVRTVILGRFIALALLLTSLLFLIFFIQIVRIGV